MKRSANKVALLGLCTALALILAYVEVLLPPVFAAVPGIKLGLPNIVIIFFFYKFGISSAATVSFIRLIAVSILFGNFMAFAYSVAGALLSLLFMSILFKLDLFSTVAVSVVGGVLHNVGQVLMAIILLDTVEIGYYLIVLSVTGIISGALVGLCGALAINRLDINNS